MHGKTRCTWTYQSQHLSSTLRVHLLQTLPRSLCGAQSHQYMDNSLSHRRTSKTNSLYQVPINVTVKEPRSRVVSKEPNRDIISRFTNAHDVADHRVIKVVRRAISAADNMERVSVQVDRMLVHHNCQHPSDESASPPALTGPPRAPAGMVISTLLLASRP
jgi:hypothetical protein